MIQWLLNFVQTYPEVLAIAGGLAAPIALTQALFMFWYPQTWTQRECFQVTSLIDLLVCYGFTSNLWHFLDHDHDAHGLIVVASLGVAICCPLVHSIGLSYVMKRFPWLEKPQPPTNPPLGGL